MWFAFGERTLEWYLGAHPCPLSPLAKCSPFAELVSNMADEQVLAIADPRDRELIRFSVGATFDVNVKILQIVIPQPQNLRPERHVHRAPGLGVCPLGEAPKRGPNAPHMGPPRQWLWMTRRAIPSWENGIALKSPFVHFGTPI